MWSFDSENNLKKILITIKKVKTYKTKSGKKLIYWIKSYWINVYTKGSDEHIIYV